MKPVLNKHPMHGIFAKTLDSAFVEIAGNSGLDFVVIDMEHGPVDIARVHDHVRALALTPARSFVRVPRLDSSVIGSVLDAKPDGLIIPNIQSAVQARQAVQFSRFHPIGSRGVCRFVRAAQFGQTESSKYFSEANQTLLACQVEGKQAVDELDSILAIEGIDILFVGPYDLSQSIGRPGELDCQELVDVVKDIVARAHNSNTAVAAFSDNPKLTSLLKAQGVGMIALSVDVELFHSGIANMLREQQRE